MRNLIKICGSGLLLAMLIQAPLVAGESISKVNGAVNAEAGKVYDELSTVNGSVNIAAGARTQEASAVNGSINLESKAQADEVSTVNGSIDGQNDLVLGSVETVNGAITIGQRAVVNKYIESVNGAIRIDFLSQIKGDVSTVNGGITLRQTTMDGSIETVNGDITIGAKSHIKGGIIVKKPNNSGWNMSWGKPRVPRIIIGPNAVVQGDIVLERKVELYVHSSAKIGTVTGGNPMSYTDKVPPRQ
jgi:DUF4097 and DUF4098 domain-containing protein YvlB